MSASSTLARVSEARVSEESVVRAPRAVRPIPRAMLGIPAVSLVIPTLNEARNLELLLPRLPDWVHEVIIVDGCSVDDTIEVAERSRADVRVVIERKRGKGAALRAGFEAARGDIIVMLDADGSMDPGEILLFVATLISGADFAKGSRFVQGAGTSDMTLLRQLGNKALTLAVRALYGSSFTDLCYGYLAFWRDHLPLLRADCDGFEIETLINIRAIKSGLKIVEVASYESDRVHGVSNLRTFPDGWRVLKTILREKFAPTAASPAPERVVTAPETAA